MAAPMLSALDRAMQRTSEPRIIIPRLFGGGAPHTPETIADWQAQLDARHDRTPRASRLLVRWEPGETWEPIDRYFLWQAVDPSHVTIEPWVLNALRGPHPRSTGHYCAPGYCLCEFKRNRWQGGATRFVDAHQWRIYQETGLYATRWWVIQGSHGGHRYCWEPGEFAAKVSQMKGHGTQPPDAGALPYAPFDERVLRAIRGEKRAKIAASVLDDMGKRRDKLVLEEQLEAERVAKALWEWQDQRAEELWSEGAYTLPRYFEEQIGRAPVGHRITTPDLDVLKERHFANALDV